MNKILAVLLLGWLPSVALAQPGLGKQELTLSGSGTSSKEFDAGAVSATGELGYYLSPQLEVGVRQSLSWRQENSSARWTGATRAYGDLHYGSSQWRPYFGASLGYIYGNDVDSTLFAGPEVGIKYYVQPAAFLFAQMEYQIFFDSATEIGSEFDDGIFFYSFGAGYNF